MLFFCIVYTFKHQKVDRKCVSPGAPAASDAERFDRQSVAQLYEYMDWFCKAPVQQDFTFNSRWLVLDCPNMQAVDGLVAYSYRQGQKLQMQGPNSRRPMLFIETCSLQDAAPSSLALSHIVYFKRECLGWREIFREWADKLTLLLDKRSLQELRDLVDTHMADLVTFLAAECKLTQPIAWVSCIRTFCHLFHYHFFLGQEVAMRYTILL